MKPPGRPVCLTGVDSCGLLANPRFFDERRKDVQAQKPTFLPILIIFDLRWPYR
ncbi:MAG: hypothetical protein AAGD23_03675 [Pseudomonadota bacterium]